jgi:hypothetical protein
VPATGGREERAHGGRRTVRAHDDPGADAGGDDGIAVADEGPHATLQQARPAGDGGLDDAGVEHRPGDDVVRAGHRAAQPGASGVAELQPVDGRPVVEEPADAEPGQDVEHLGRDAVAAGLVAREGGTVEQSHADSRRGGEDGECGGGAGGAGADDGDVHIEVRALGRHPSMMARPFAPALAG